MTTSRRSVGGFTTNSGRRFAKEYVCYSERVEKPADIRPALERAAKAGVPSLVNVMVETELQVNTQNYTAYEAGTVGQKRTYGE